MKYLNYIAFVLVFISQGILAQTVIKDTVYIGKHTMSHLVFTEPIALADYGSPNLVTANKEQRKIGTPVINALTTETHVVSIKASKKFKAPTNISVITHTNLFYDICCMYSDMPVSNYYYFDPKNKLNPEANDTLVTPVSVDPDAADEEVLTALQKDKVTDDNITRFYRDTIRYKGIAKTIYSTKTKRLKHAKTTVEKITLQLVGVYTLKDKIYVKLSIYNNGSIPFVIDSWSYTFRNKGGFNPRETPSSSIVPVYECNDRHIKIVPKDVLTKVFVFDSFTLDRYSSLYIQLREKGQQRSPVLEIKNTYINNAFPVELK